MPPSRLRVPKMAPHKPEVRFIVQDKESALFLMPCEGDVGFTPWAHEAGRFDGFAEACDTAAINCHEGFFVTQVIQ
jgi:hypothetical protein